ncbi:DNA-binding beta-propeller fold protein YncE [Catenulispora sp. EB89]|uniref:Ig-like domain repeat protein n=1 Tax=Catenulispora sp. EB89 TaxID=3156257 RepID=UPI0035134FC8
MATVTLPVSSNPMDIVVNPAGTTAYVDTSPVTRVYAIDLATDTVATSFQSYGSVAEAIDPTGSRLYGADDRTMDDGAFAVLDTGIGAYLGAVKVAGEPSAVALGPVASGTTTALAVSPSGITTHGTTVTLTATVAGAASGTVQFYDSPTEGVSPTPLGAPVPVSGGTAAITTSTLTVDTHALSAAFTPSTAGLLRSASAQVSPVVNP